MGIKARGVVALVIITWKEAYMWKKKIEDKAIHYVLWKGFMKTKPHFDVPRWKVQGIYEVNKINSCNLNLKTIERFSLQDVSQGSSTKQIFCSKVLHQWVYWIGGDWRESHAHTSPRQLHVFTGDWLLSSFTYLWFYPNVKNLHW